MKPILVGPEKVQVGRRFALYTALEGIQFWFLISWLISISIQSSCHIRSINRTEKRILLSTKAGDSQGGPPMLIYSLIVSICLWIWECRFEFPQSLEAKNLVSHFLDKHSNQKVFYKLFLKATPWKMLYLKSGKTSGSSQQFWEVSRNCDKCKLNQKRLFDTYSSIKVIP